MICYTFGHIFSQYMERDLVLAIWYFYEEINACDLAGSHSENPLYIIWPHTRPTHIDTEEGDSVLLRNFHMYP